MTGWQRTEPFGKSSPVTPSLRALPVGELEFYRVAPLPVQGVEEAESIARRQYGPASTLSRILYGGIDPLEAVLHIPRLIADEDHSSCGAPEVLRSIVQAHQCPRFMELLGWIGIGTCHAGRGRQ